MLKDNLLFCSVLLLLSVAPFTVCAQEQPNYISGGAGLVFFGDDVLDRTHLGVGFDGEMAYGRYLNPNFVLEVATGYFHHGHAGDDVRGIPLRLTAKAVYLMQNLRLSVGGGVGMYWAKFDGHIDNAPADDTDMVLGGHFTAGIEFDVWSPFFIGTEGKYLFIEKAAFDQKSMHLNAFTAIVKLGYRF